MVDHEYAVYPCPIVGASYDSMVEELGGVGKETGCLNGQRRKSYT